MKIDFGQFIHALSDTIDLVGIDEIQHGKRVGFMALECAKLMGADLAEQTMLYRLGLLHDCGVSSTRVHKKLVDELDWTESQQHCLIGAERVERFAPLAQFGPVIRYHHTRWEKLKWEKLDDTVKQQANLIFLLDRVDALVAMSGSHNRLAVRDTICQKISQFRNLYFQSELVDVFLAAAEKEAFWITQEPEHLRSYLELKCSAPAELFLDTDQLAKMARIFAEVVDAKSPYTAEHCFGVTQLSGHLARRVELSHENISKMEVAGLLHDLGKLQVPDKILESKGRLEGENLAIMRHHSYVTYMILSRIKGLEEISLWAANHHEKLDGSGYPFRRNGHELSIESRIIMVADIFQALAQNRPYRKPLPTDVIVGMLKGQAEKGQLDKEIVSIVESEPELCHRIAICK
ncbi:HD domain-containing phosphohydrolase [Desulfopila aestuarii]|uniref:HDIG domain-containing protein n=1 Tax=Desulfopila aestuarii DSM 18488 TaxID=1121416 RepID=A0A1M7YGJ3_9BACT|nr:HD domain-containing phosphohydrolase [Desulfopila aestuarii]SHO51711.1 HDIG domain-containing protein [Desulfopila aestuarii DSM 18488]